MSSALSSAFRVVGSLTLLSRVLGLVRDVVTARLFGDTAIGSAFAAAFAVPNTFRRLFGEGALAAAFVPEYAALVERDRRAADRFASFTVCALGLATAALTLLGELGLWLALSMAPAGSIRATSIALVMLALPFMPLICLSAMLAGMLQVHGRFAPPAAQPIVLNACVLLAAGVHALRQGASKESAAAMLCLAVVASGLVQLVWCLLALRPYVRWTRAMAGVGRSARRLLRRWGPALVGLGTLQVSALLDVLLAMWPIWFGPMILAVRYPLDEQANAVLFYAQRLYQFPLGVFAVAVATAAFPILSRLANSPAAFRQAAVDALALSLGIALPAGVGLMLVAGDLTATLFAGGQGFSSQGAQRSAAVLVGYASCIWAYAANQVLTRACYARGDTKGPAVVAVGVLLANLAGNLLLIWPLREAGLAWSTAIAAVMQTLVLLAWLRARHDLPLARAVLARSWKALPCTAAMAIVVLVVLIAWEPGQGWTGRAARLGACVALGAAAYGLAALAMGYREPLGALRGDPRRRQRP
ncbi:MAG: putative lipid II flippase MurJ [Phycisphaerales bacterium]|nr:MAG: putative lipid II flippase MurJ [Phycisphaerales bacterium]